MKVDLETGTARGGTWMRDIERLAIPFEFADMEFDSRLRPERASPYSKLTEMCPKLREMIIILGTKCDAHTSVMDSEDQWEVWSEVNLPVDPWDWWWEIPNFRFDEFKAKKLERVRKLKVKFVKMR